MEGKLRAAHRGEARKASTPVRRLGGGVKAFSSNSVGMDMQ